MSERLDLSRTNIGLDEVLEECYRLQDYERLYLESVAVATTLRERVRVLEELLPDVRRMCEIVLGNILGNKELDSLAFYVGHHSDVLNSLTGGKGEGCKN